MSVVTRVYTLSDPRTGSVRYVGATRKSLAERLRDHEQSVSRVENKAPRYEWLRELKSLGISAIIDHLETVPESESATTEQKWILEFRSRGCDLLNRKPGGGGPSSTAQRRPWSQQQKNAASARSTSAYQDDPDLAKRVSQGTRKGMARMLAEEGQQFRAKVSQGLHRRYESVDARIKTGEASTASWAAMTPERREEFRSNMRAAVAKEQRIKCPSCDMVSRPANIARHRRARGH